MSQIATSHEDSWAPPPEIPGHPPAGRGFGRRVWRGRPDDPAWARPGLIALLATTAVLYIWDLGASGWANSFYAAAVQAGTRSWKAFLYGSFDPSNFITVDKSPASLWVMEISGRIFGFNAWSMLVPQALEGVATVGLVYLTVRRWMPAGAGLIAGLVTALTPAAALMFRFNNPDALMVLLLTASAYATVRAVEGGRARWMVLAGSAVGFAFLAKMLEAFLVVPALALVVLVAGRGHLRDRIRLLLYGAVALALAGGWWVALVQLTPASARPYIGGSQDNSLWNLMFGYNGFGRLDGNETGSVDGGTVGTAGRWGATGLTRLFGSEMGTQASWLLPAALLLLVAGLIVTRRADRTNRTRAALLMWGGWLIVTGLAFSLGQGIIHPYYTVALAPAVGGLIGVGGALVWANRTRPAARALMAVAVTGTGSWAWVLLGRTPHWAPWLRPAVLVAALLGAAAATYGPVLPTVLRRSAACVTLFACLAAPFGYTLSTVRSAHTGAIPSAGPPGASTGGLPGGGGFGPRAQGAAGRVFAGGFPGGPNGFPGGTGTRGGAGGRPGPNGFAGAPTGAGAQGGAGGGLLGASRPSAALTALLQLGASRYEWVAATVGANSAAGYQLASGDAVVAIGGFNGTDPYPTLAGFEKLVSESRVHYFIAGGGGFGGPGGSSSGTSSAITGWVESHFQASTVTGTTVYDLTRPVSGNSR